MVWWIVATVVAFFVKGICGFGDGLLFGTVMSFANDNIIITPVQTLMSLPSNSILAWKNRKSINLKFCLPVMAMVLFGDTVGAFMLKSLDTHLLKVIFGLVIIGIGVEMYLRDKSGKKAKTSPIVLTFIGILSGIVCGLFSVGTLLSAYFERVTNDTDSFKGNMCFVFVADVVYRNLIYLFNGTLTLQVLRYALMLMPVMVAALFLGIYSSKVLSEKLVRRAVIVMLVISGLALAVTNL